MAKFSTRKFLIASNAVSLCVVLAALAIGGWHAGLLCGTALHVAALIALAMVEE